MGLGTPSQRSHVADGRVPGQPPQQPSEPDHGSDTIVVEVAVLEQVSSTCQTCAAQQVAHDSVLERVDVLDAGNAHDPLRHSGLLGDVSGRAGEASQPQAGRIDLLDAADRLQLPDASEYVPGPPAQID